METLKSKPEEFSVSFVTSNTLDIGGPVVASMLFSPTAYKLF